MMDLLFVGVGWTDLIDRLVEFDPLPPWLYLPETLYAFMLIIIVSAGAGPCSFDALILGLINKHAA